MARHEALLDIKQAAQFLQVSETSLRRWTNSGRLPCLRVGRKRERRFLRADLLAFMEVQPLAIEADPPRAAEVAAHHALIDGIAVPHGAHLCGLYATDAGRVKLAASFVAGGLRPRNACVLVARPKARQDILAQLNKWHPSVDADVKSGRLVLGEYRAAADEQYDYLRAHLATAMRSGARSLRVVGDVSSFAEGAGADAVAEYEAGYERAIAERFPVVTLCTYDVRLFSGVEILTAFKGHPHSFRYPCEWLLA
jgi:excisionase family DNA binding protein